MNLTPAVEFSGTSRFTICRQLGAGGMGVVYEALDRDRNARVALKTLHNCEPQHLYLFKQEFRSLADIVDENLIPLYELISDGDVWFFTMELIENGSEFLPYIRGKIHLDRSAADSKDTANIGGGKTDAVIAVRNPNQQKTDSESDSMDAAKSDPGNAASSHDTDSEDVRETVIRPVEGKSPEEASPEYRATMLGDQSDFESDEAVLEDDEPTRRECTVDIEHVRKTMLGVARGVQALHSHGKLHRDLKPANTMIRSDGSVVLLDFGLVVEMNSDQPHPSHAASALDEKRQFSHISSDATIAGTIPYMAPEQARVQPLTPATDWYAFGTMLFEALTGQLPFRGKPLAIIQKKISSDGPAPSECCDGIPDDLDQLCRDLLQVDARKRPSGREILECLGGKTASESTEQEFTEAVALPFVGRNEHLGKLAKALNHVREGNPVVYRIHGRSGAGKSALIQKFLDDIVARDNAVVLAGRCYEQESVPYKAVDSLVDALTRFLHKLPPVELEALLPEDSGVLARLFPVLKRIPAIQQKFEAASAMTDLREMRRLAIVALKNLFAKIAKQHPLVLYIDDLQWGDTDSATLLAQLIQPPETPQVLLLLAFRSEYAETSDCLKSIAALAAEHDRNAFPELVVDSLTTEETTELTRTLIGRNSPDVERQTDWIINESGGSALFIYELVRYLKSGRDLSEIQGIHLDEVLWQRVERLPVDARELLEVIAVSGQPMRLRYAQEAAGLASLPSQISRRLRSEQLVRSSGSSLDDDIETFHDRIRESVVDHLSVEAARRRHLGLALTLEHAGDAEPDQLAVHFEFGEAPAKASVYYLAAADRAVEVLAFERAEELYGKAADLAYSEFAKAAVFERMIHYYTDMARFEEAYAIAREATSLFGVRLPAKFIPPLFIADFLLSKLRLRRRKANELLELPTMTDERLGWVVRIGNACMKAAYQIRPELCVAVSTKLVNLCLKHGNTPDCAIGYMVYGAIFQGGVMGIYQTGFDYGRLALLLVEKFDNAKQRAEVNFVVGYFGTSWLRPVTEAEELWKTAYRSGLETNDLFHTGCACAGTIMSYHMRGAPMKDIWEASENFLEFLNRAQLREPLGCLYAVRQAIRNLQGKTVSHTSFSDETFNEEEFANQLESYGSRHFAHYYFINRMQILYLWGENESALRTAEQSARYLKDSTGMLHSAEHHFYHGLILSAIASNDPRRRRKFLAKLRKIHSKFQKWAALCEHNFLHKERLLAAEIFCLQEKKDEAAQAYCEAMDAAEAYQYAQIRALAAQRASVLEQLRGNRVLADSNKAEAVKSYRTWGASAYADYLEKQGS